VTSKGAYSRGFITNVPADLDSDIARHYKSTLPYFPEEGLYIYSFKEGKMLYAQGWEEVVGLPSNAVSMVDVVNFTAPQFALFVEEVNDKALMFLHQHNEDLKEYSFTIELKLKHQDGHEVPVVARVSVYDTNEDGSLQSIMGSFRVNRSLRFGRVMRYASFGPKKSKFENALDPSLFKVLVISDKEREALVMAAKGLAFKQIADELQISRSAVEKRILPLYKRFEVRSLTHLVSFAYENYLLG